METLDGYKRVTGDVVWTPKTAAIVGVTSFFIGVVSATTGVGGGVLLGPLMLELHILPEVAVAGEMILRRPSLSLVKSTSFCNTLTLARIHQS